ncbi:ECM-binding protein homolog [Mycoplasmopsis columboralis]|uniref:ECM-binding protein homolog n=1 Tax=Mycoplasmopsis columboralis TaxID=171282 RepID=A0A449B7H9_9BACT|nr:GA module-containing protein [Mycoplasmopsis columboralis]VEU76545.1 ECM-binding protein homolog [Mycoplasmopsis columboralis]
MKKKNKISLILTTSTTAASIIAVAVSSISVSPIANTQAEEQARVDALVAKVTGADYSNKQQNTPALEFSNALNPTTTPMIKELTEAQKAGLSFTITDNGQTYTSVYENGKHIFKDLNVYVKHYYFSDFSPINDRTASRPPDNNIPTTEFPQYRYTANMNIHVSLGSLSETFDANLTERPSQKITINGFLSERFRLRDKVQVGILNGKLATEIFTPQERALKASTFIVKNVVNGKTTYRLRDDIWQRVVALANNHPEAMAEYYEDATRASSFDDEAGTLRISARVRSNRPDGFQEISTSTFSMPVRGGFWSNTKEKQRLATLMNNLEIEYSPNDIMLNYPNQYVFNDQTKPNYVFYTTDSDGVRHTSVYNNGEYVFEDLKTKITLFENVDTISNTNDATGSFSVRAQMTSFREQFEGITSEIVTKKVTGFKTETVRLNEILASKNDSINALQFEESRRNNALPSSVTDEEVIQKLNTILITNDLATIKAENIIGKIVKDDINGTITVTFKLNSTRDDLTDQTSSQDNAVTKTFNWFLTRDKDIEKSIVALKEQIDDKPYLSNEEKNKLKADLDAIQNSYNTSELDSEQKYNQAKEAITNIKTLTDNTNTSKEREINDVETNYPLLNKAQRDQIKADLKSSNLLDTIENPQNPSVEYIRQKAQNLSNSMQNTQNNIDNDETFKTTDGYTNAPQNLKDLYNAAILASKNLVPNNAETGENLATPDLSTLTDWSDSVAKPENSNYSKNAVDELNRVLQAIKTKMNELDEAKKAAKDAIDNMDYLSPEEKEAFKANVDNATTPSEVTSAQNEAKSVNDTKKAKVDQIDDQYPNLNTNQKEQLAQTIKNSNLNSIEGSSGPTVADTLSKGSQLNDSMGTLKDFTNNDDAFKRSPLYTQATPEAKAQYDKLLNAANNLKNNINPDSNDLNSTNIAPQSDAAWDKENVDKLNSAIKQAQAEAAQSIIDQLANLSQEEKNNLKNKINSDQTLEQMQAVVNGAETLNANKQGEINKINAFEHLNNSQKTNIIQKIKDANLDPDLNPQSPKVSDEVAKATTLDKAMEKLENLVNNKDNVHTQDKYNNATDESKNNYDKLVQAGNQLKNNTNPDDVNLAPLVNLTKPETPNWSLEDVQKLTQGIEDTLKQATKDAINKLPNLSQAEKDALNNLVDAVEDTNSNDLDNVLNKAKTINDKKQQTIDSINALDYLSNDEKEKYINNVKAEDLSGVDNFDTDTTLTDDLNASKTTNDAKKAKDKTLNLEHLNADQRAAVTQAIKDSNLESIEGKNNTPSTENAIANGTTLDESMKNLKDVKNAQPEVTSSQLFDLATQDAKDKFNNLIEAIKELENNTNPDADKVNDPNINETSPNWSKDSVDTLKADTINALKDAYKKGIDNLPNLSNDEKQALKDKLDNPEIDTLEEIKAIEQEALKLNADKQKEIDAVEANYPHLNQAQKDGVKNAIKKANLDPALKENSPTVASVKNTASELDASMDKSHQRSTEEEKVKSSELFANATADTKAKYEKALEAAKQLQSNQNPQDVSELEGVTPQNSANWPKEPVDALKANLENTLKDVAKSYVDNLPNLSDAEKTALKNAITNLIDPSFENIKDLTDKAKAINNKKQDTIDAINALDYLSNDEKEKHINDVKGEDLSNVPNLAEDQTLTQDLQEAKATNDAKKAKDQALDLPYLNESQRAAVTQAIKDSNLNEIPGKEDTPSTEDAINDGKALNESMKELDDLKNAQDDIKASELFNLATPESQDKYNTLIDAIKELQDNNNPTSDPNVVQDSPNWPKNSVDTLKVDTINALKEAYKKGIDNLPNLSDDEKEALKNKLDDAQADTLAEVQAIAKEATDLNKQKQAEIDAVESTYPHLNDSQQQAVRDAIKKANVDPKLKEGSPTLENVKDTAEALDASMEELINRTNEDENVKASDLFAKASEESKAKYLKALEASKQLQNDQNPNVDGLDNLNTQENANWVKDPVDKLKANLQEGLKDVAKSYIDNLSNLNENEKSTLKDLVTNLKNPTFDDIEKVANRAKEINDRKQDAIDAVIAGKYLSEDEKNYFKKQIVDTDYSNEANDEDNDIALAEIINVASLTNTDKKTQYDNLDSLPHLNDSQRQALKEDVINSNLNAIPNSNNPSTESVSQKGTQLDNSMKQLRDFLALNPEILQGNTYNNATDDSKSNFDDVVSLGVSLANNQTPKADTLNKVNTTIADSAKQLNATNTTPNWDKDNVDKLNAQLLEKYKQLVEDNIDKLPYLSDEEKQQLVDKLKSSDTNDKAKVDKILKLANDVNAQKQEIVNKINDLPHLSEVEKQSFTDDVIASNQVQDPLNTSPEEPNDQPNNSNELEDILDNSRKADLDKAFEDYIQNNLTSEDTNGSREELQNLQDLIKTFEDDDKTKDKDTDYSNYKEVAEALKNIADLKDAYNAYLNADVSNVDEYSEAKNKLESKITQVNKDIESLEKQTFNDPRLEDVKAQMLAQAKKDVSKADAEKEIVDALVNLAHDAYNPEHFEAALASAQAKLDSAEEDKNNILLSHLRDPEINYPALADKSDNDEGLDEDEYNRYKPTLESPMSNVVKSALQNFGPYRAHLSDEAKAQYKAQLDELEYLSPQERELFENQIDKAERNREARAIIEEAKNVNAAKKEIADHIRDFKHLNDSQKQAYIDEVKANPLQSKDPQSEKSMDQILEDTQKLDDKMLELKNALKEALNTKKTPIYQNASEAKQNDFDWAIRDGQKTVDNLPPRKHLDPNLNLDEVQTLIDNLKIQADQAALSAIDNLPYVLEKDKDKLKEELNKAKNQDEVIKVLNKAKTTNDLIKQTIDALNDFNKNTNAENSDKINDLLNKLAKVNPEVNLDNFKDTKEAIKANKELSDVLKAYRDSEIQSDTYEQAKTNLENVLTKGVVSLESPYSQMNDLVSDVLSASTTLNAQGHNEIALVEALVNLNKENFDLSMLNNQTAGAFDKYNALADKIKKSAYFDLLKEAAKNNNHVINAIYQLIKEVDDENASNVIRSALLKNFKPLKVGYNSWWKCWWWYVILSVGSASLVALAIAAGKRFKRSNKQ